LTQLQFIPYGATLTNLFVKGKDGTEIDVVLGYDDAAYYGMFLRVETTKEFMLENFTNCLN